MSKIESEQHLSGPVKTYLEEQGYVVRSEVNGCDLVARRGDDLIVVELKRSLRLDLLLQGIDRQRVVERVFLAIEAPRRRAQRWRRLLTLCKRLQFGLLTVSYVQRVPRVQMEIDAPLHGERLNSKRRTRLLKEFTGRSGDFNVGGSPGTPLVTVYREESLLIAAHLAEHGPSRVGAVREATGIKGCGTILYRNVYGWFERISRGVYDITADGLEALREYARVLEHRT